MKTRAVYRWALCFPIREEHYASAEEAFMRYWKFIALDAFCAKSVKIRRLG